MNAKLQDTDGHESDASVSLTVTVDTSAPTFTSGASATATDENTGGSQVIYTAATDASNVTYSLKAPMMITYSLLMAAPARLP